MADAPRLGFIGLGLMGHGIAANLIKHGYPLTILAHHNRAPVDDLVGRGAVEAKDAAAVAATSDIVFLCLPSSAEVAATCGGERGLFAGLAPGKVIVDATTADPAVSVALGKAAAALGCDFVDAPLGRTPREAEAGRLSTYLGGRPEAIERIRPILGCYADAIVVCGAAGAGATCKLLNNSVSMSLGVLIAETFATAAKLGVDLDALADVLSAGAADGRIWRMMAPWIREGDDSHLQGSLKLVGKDLRTYGKMAAAADAKTPIADAASRMLDRAIAAGHGDRFLPTLPGILARLAGSAIRDTDLV